MKKRLITLIFLILIQLTIYAISHSDEQEDFALDHSQLYPLSQLEAVGYGSMIFGSLLLIIVLLHKKVNELIKKITYFLVAATALLVTAYLVITTLHLNIISETKGPVHWHADFEIWICDNEIKLAEPKGLSNKQGVDLMHAHNDNRIHVEGVLLETKSASLGAFFHAIDGHLTNDEIQFPTEKGMISMHNGDVCNDNQAKLYVFVNGNLIENFRDYVISPYEKVPPGDRIKFVFTEKPIGEINPYIASEDTNVIENKHSAGCTSEAPCVGSNQPSCDLDSDFDCDENDLEILEASMESCSIFYKNGTNIIEGNYNHVADIDSSGCVTQNDREYFLQRLKEYNKNKKS